MQTAFGRRPVVLVSTLICLVSNIWRALAKDYRSFMGACILNGIGAGMAEVGQDHSRQAYALADTMFRQLSPLSLQTSCSCTSEELTVPSSSPLISAP